MNIRSVMLVDDESVVRMTATLILKKIGCDVVAFDNGMAAIEYYRHNADAVDLVILDSHMPSMSGTETFRELRGINPSVKAILASGFLSEDEVNATASIGFVAQLWKPFHVQELHELLSTL